MGNEKIEDLSQRRRDFITKCGRFALVAPPTMALMLSAVDRKYALAFSGTSGDDDGSDKPKLERRERRRARRRARRSDRRERRRIRRRNRA